MEGLMLHKSTHIRKFLALDSKSINKPPSSSSSKVNSSATTELGILDFKFRFIVLIILLQVSF